MMGAEIRDRSGSARKPRVSVILACYYSHNTLAQCLDGLRAQTFRDFEVVAINSSPENETAAILSRYREVIFRQSPVRLFPHAARNRGVEIACGDLLVFSDPDCVAREDWLERLVSGVDHERSTGHSLQSPSSVVGGSMGLLAGQSRLALGVHLCKFHWLLPGLPDGPRWILPTANVAYPREIWDAVGPFDECSMAADALLSWQARRQGFGLVFVADAIVDHCHDDTYSGFLSQRFGRGAEFVSIRARHLGWSRARLLINVVGLPTLGLLVGVRAGWDALRAGWFLQFLHTLPVQVLGHYTWAAGEAKGSWRLLFEPRGRAVPGSSDGT